MAGELRLPAGPRSCAPMARKTPSTTTAIAAIQSPSFHKRMSLRPLTSSLHHAARGCPGCAAHPNGEIPLVKPIVARPRAMLGGRHDAQRPFLAAVAARNPPLRAARATWSRPARRRPSSSASSTIAARTPDHGKLSPWRFVIVARRPARRASPTCWPRRLARRRSRRAAARSSTRPSEFAHQAPALVVLLSAADRRPQDPGVGTGIVVRRGGDEPAPRRPRARLRRRLGDRLGGLFGQRSAPPSADRASGSPGSSSSARPARELEERPRPDPADGRAATGSRRTTEPRLNFLAPCCISTA